MYIHSTNSDRDSNREREREKQQGKIYGSAVSIHSYYSYSHCSPWHLHVFPSTHRAYVHVPNHTHKHMHTHRPVTTGWLGRVFSSSKRPVGVASDPSSPGCCSCLTSRARGDWREPRGSRRLSQEPGGPSRRHRGGCLLRSLWVRAGTCVCVYRDQTNYKCLPIYPLKTICSLQHKIFCYMHT